MKNDKIQNGRHLFSEKKKKLCILPVTIDFFHLTLHRNNGHQANLELHLIKSLYHMKMTKIQNDRRLFEKMNISTKSGKPILKNIPTSLKVTIKGFNIDS